MYIVKDTPKIPHPDEYPDYRVVPLWGMGPAEDAIGEVIRMDDKLWTAWAFAGARAARSCWRRFYGRNITGRLAVDMAEVIGNLVREAERKAWLPPEATDIRIAVSDITTDSRITLRIGNVPREAEQAFLTGWQVAAEGCRSRRTP